LAIFGLLLVAQAVQGQSHGCPPDNLLPNCNFDRFYGSPPRQLPEGFKAYLAPGSGDLDFSLGTDTQWGAPSLRMWSDGGTFHAGIFTQVGGLQPGVTYKASLGWGVGDPWASFGRRLGIDPTGGTDPNAPTVVWSKAYWGQGKALNWPPPDPANIDVSAVAQASTITVFADVEHNSAAPPNWVFLDALSLVKDPNQAPPPTPVPPTATAAPAVAPAPTRRPTATARPTVTPTATVADTATPTQTPLPTATPTHTPTPAPTDTPAPTATSTLPPRPRATAGTTQPGAAAMQLPSAPGTGRGLLYGGLGALSGAGVLGLALVLGIMRRK
jgi:hypothetical protein